MLKSLLLMLGVVFLASCGFQLRGVDRQLPPRFSQTFIVSDSGNTLLFLQVRDSINLNGGSVVIADKAITTVQLSAVASRSRQIALSGNGVLKEYERTYEVTATVSDSVTGMQLGSRTLTAVKSVQLDDTRVLAGEEQSKITEENAIRELSRAVIRYLGSF